MSMEREKSWGWEVIARSRTESALVLTPRQSLVLRTVRSWVLKKDIKRLALELG
jgi:hypothetical protein